VADRKRTADMRREELKAARAIARAVAEDVAVAIREHIEDAQKRGQPFDSFARTFRKALAAKGWWGRRDQVDAVTGLPVDTPEKIPHRVALVIQTNTRTARDAGEWTRVQRRKAELPLLRYDHGDPERDRPAHVPYWSKPVILPVDHPFWAIAYGSNGYGCTCHTTQIAAGPAPTPDEELPPKQVIRGKETYPGIPWEFAYNPGKDRLEGLRRAGILRRE
jgi:uncharacterized protein with gpF-like domain